MSAVRRIEAREKLFRIKKELVYFHILLQSKGKIGIMQIISCLLIVKNANLHINNSNFNSNCYI